MWETENLCVLLYIFTGWAWPFWKTLNSHWKIDIVCGCVGGMCVLCVRMCSSTIVYFNFSIKRKYDIPNVVYNRVRPPPTDSIHWCFSVGRSFFSFQHISLHMFVWTNSFILTMTVNDEQIVIFLFLFRPFHIAMIAQNTLSAAVCFIEMHNVQLLNAASHDDTNDGHSYNLKSFWNCCERSRATRRPKTKTNRGCDFCENFSFLLLVRRCIDKSKGSCWRRKKFQLQQHVIELPKKESRRHDLSHDKLPSTFSRFDILRYEQNGQQQMLTFNWQLILHSFFVVQTVSVSKYFQLNAPQMSQIVFINPKLIYSWFSEPYFEMKSCTMSTVGLTCEPKQIDWMCKINLRKFLSRLSSRGRDVEVRQILIYNSICVLLLDFTALVLSCLILKSTLKVDFSIWSICLEEAHRSLFTS